MNCCQHETRHATGQCVDCGRFLCKECMQRWKPPLCDDCVEMRCGSAAEPAKGTVKLACFLGIVGGSGCMLWLFRIMGMKACFVAAIIAYILAGIPFGWNAVSKKTAISLLWMPVIGWLLRVVLALIMGLVMLPVSLYRISINW